MINTNKVNQVLKCDDILFKNQSFPIMYQKQAIHKTYYGNFVFKYKFNASLAFE